MQLRECDLRVASARAFRELHRNRGLVLFSFAGNRRIAKRMRGACEERRRGRGGGGEGTRVRGKGEARKRAIIHSRRRRRELSRRCIRLVVMHRVTLHAVKQGYQFAVHASFVRVARRGRSLFPLTGYTERIRVAQMTRDAVMMPIE